MISPLFAGSGLRIKIIGAMSCGRPVVATPVAAEGIVNSEGNALIVAPDAGSFCTALVRFLEDPESRLSAGKDAVKLVQNRYDNRALTARLLEFYKELKHDS